MTVITKNASTKFQTNLHVFKWSLIMKFNVLYVRAYGYLCTAAFVSVLVRVRMCFDVDFQAQNVCGFPESIEIRPFCLSLSLPLSPSPTLCLSVSFLPCWNCFICILIARQSFVSSSTFVGNNIIYLHENPAASPVANPCMTKHLLAA